MFYEISFDANDALPHLYLRDPRSPFINTLQGKELNSKNHENKLAIQNRVTCRGFLATTRYRDYANRVRERDASTRSLHNKSDLAELSAVNCVLSRSRARRGDEEIKRKSRGYRKPARANSYLFKVELTSNEPTGGRGREEG